MTTPQETEETTEKKVDYESSMEQIGTLLRAHVPFVWVTTYEESRFVEAFYSEVVDPQNKEMLTWSSYKGITHYGTEETVKRASGKFDKTWQPNIALEAIDNYERSKSKSGTVFILKDFHTVLTQPIPRMMRDMYQSLICGQKTLVILSPCLAHGPSGTKPGIEPTLDKQIVVLDYELPSRDYIDERVKSCIYTLHEANEDNKKNKAKLSYSDEEYNKFAMALQGLTELEVDNAIGTSLCHLQRLDEKKLLLEKKQIIQRSEILEYIGQSTSMSEVGGLDLAKQYFNAYSGQFSPEAKKFGVEPLRGVLLTGVPGAGKSLIVKAVSEIWSLPLLRLDVGKVMSGLVGSSIRGSEEVVWYEKDGTSHRNTIKELVELAPNNCWVDTYNDSGSQHRAQVTDFIAHEIKPTDKLYRLSLEDGRSIVTTGDHGVFTPNDDLTMKETRVDELKSQQYIATPGALYTESKLPGTWLEGFLGGAWLGDGDYNAKDVRLHLNVLDQDSFSAVLDEANLNYSIYKSSSSDKGIVIHVRDGLRAKMEKQGFVGKAHTKRVPSFVFGMSCEYITGLLSGYFSTDGSFSGHVLEVSSVSKNLRDDIAHLLHKVGIHAFVTEKISDKGFRTKEGIDYYINISAETDLSIFQHQIGFVQDYKAENLANRKEANAHGYYVPLTENVKQAINASRRGMWKQLHTRPYGFDSRCDAIGLETINKCKDFISKENVDHKYFLHSVAAKPIRWIKVKGVKEVPKEENETMVYDLSVPGHGLEKFIAGSCPMLVHNSEQKMREVVNQVETLAPAILWIDEIEKSLSGTKSSNVSDGGTLARVFGTLLTAMEERMQGVVTLATANDISALPPELIRRFNEVLFVDLPLPSEREEIFQIHLQKRGRDSKKLKLNIDKLVKATHLFTGSEIEKAIKEGIARAFTQKKKDINTSILLGACNSTKPIAKIMKEKIDSIREWARDRARYASSLAEAANAPGAQKVTTKQGKELDLSGDLDDLDEVKTGQEQTKESQKNKKQFAQFDGILDE